MPPASEERVLSFAAALAEVLHHAHPLTAHHTETVSLIDATSRILASPITAERDQPPFDRSTRDGYAVRSADLPTTPRHVTGTIRAGQSWQGPPLQPGEALEIMTGAPIPPGADAVVMVEHVTAAGDSIHIDPTRTPHPGDNIIPRAAEAHAGDTLLPIGRPLNAAEIAVAASSGCATLQVFAKSTVAIVATGDELVELPDTPEPHQIRNSNTYALAALVTLDAGHPIRLPIARDTLDDLRARIATGRQSDLLLLSGGVSMGKYDLVEQVLREAGAEVFFTGALIQPGKPIVFGRLPKSTGGHTYFFGLPGNPVSTQVCFHLFVAPILRALSGRKDIAPRFTAATLAADVKGNSRVTRFLPADLESSWDHVTVRLVNWQGSGDVAANARGNAYAVLPANTPHFSAGETIRVLLR
jgi:molybdopterin molybdotransferase